MKSVAQILSHARHKKPCYGSGYMRPTDRLAGRVDLPVLCSFYVLCTKQHECRTQVLMFLNKLNVLPFGSNVYPKRQARMPGYYNREWRQPVFCFIYSASFCLSVKVLLAASVFADHCKLCEIRRWRLHWFSGI
jgi:hypothetical protein